MAHPPTPLTPTQKKKTKTKIKENQKKKKKVCGAKVADVSPSSSGHWGEIRALATKRLTKMKEKLE